MTTCSLQTCGVEFVDDRKNRRGRSRKFCTDKCARVASQRRQTVQCVVNGCSSKMVARGLCRNHYKQQVQGTRRVIRTCERCGDSYETSRTNGRFCSLRCRDSRSTCTELVHVGPSWPRCDIPRKHPCRRPAEEQASWWTVLAAVNCGFCAEQFILPYGRGVKSFATKYCSSQCRANAGVSRRGRFAISQARRLSIYVRDGWTCQLCGDPVDPSLGRRDLWSATLDHIRCQSWGEPDHSDENLRLAHMWCNSVRGDERFHTADVLVA